MKPMFEWTDDEIRDYYDQNPNLTILTYAGMLGLSGGELKEILNTDGEWKLEFGSAVDKQEAETAEEMFRDPEPVESRTEYCYRMGFDM